MIKKLNEEIKNKGSLETIIDHLKASGLSDTDASMLVAALLEETEKDQKDLETIKKSN